MGGAWPTGYDCDFFERVQVGEPHEVKQGAGGRTPPPENPQKCCTGRRISLTADDNGDNQASPFFPASLPFTLLRFRGGLNPTGGVKVVREANHGVDFTSGS